MLTGIILHRCLINQSIRYLFNMTQEKILVSLIHFLNEGSKDKRAIESFLGRGKNIDHYLDELNVLGIYPQIKNDIFSIEKIELLDKSLIAEILSPLENSFQIQLMIEDIIETTSKAFSPSEIFNNRVTQGAIWHNYRIVSYGLNGCVSPINVCDKSSFTIFQFNKITNICFSTGD